MQKYSPDGICQIDPRNGNLIIYNSARAKRIHTTVEAKPITQENEFCPLCEGKISEIFDLVKHRDGFSFINKNIYPISHTIDELPDEDADYFSHQDSEA
ncbi:hypothetical protein [Psychromonas hadalis]|uniref:hypothetical protein n=1 Tax=Psychromonas hadalis TaxID=211669 RepID=UPI0003B46B39|nr:hypothetical protein [Psychromonas hadalis]